jgi:alkyl sulfatase BDS1-like metallo-beta-lactamase superfamily hydrolase
VRRATLPPPAGSRVYELTVRGRQLEEVVVALGRFGSVAPFPPGDAQIGVDAVVIALKSLFDAAAADGLSASYELRLGEQRFALDVADGRLAVQRGGAPAADAVIETDPGTLATVLWHGRALDEARRAGDVAIEGDRRAVTRLLRLFRLPST